MSAIDSGMDVFASPLSPLTHNLLRGAMPNSMGMQAGGQPGTIRNTGGGSYMRAHNMARGTPTPQGGMAGGGPLNNAIMTAAMLDAAGVGDDERDKYRKITDPAQLKEVLALRHPHPPKQTPVDMGFGQATAEAQPTIGGPTPQGIAPGTMTVGQGRGPNAMSASDLAQWQQNIQGKLGAGESVDANGIGAGPWAQRQPGTQYRELTGQPGFSVGGMTPPAAAQPQTANPLGQAVQSHLKQFPNSLVTAMQNATPQQIIQQINKERSEGQTQTRQQDTEKRNDQRDVQRENRQYTHEEITDLHSQLREAAKDMNTAEVQRIQTELNQKINGMKPQQAAPQPQQPGQGGQPVQIADPAQVAGLPSGTPFTINGHVYRKD